MKIHHPTFLFGAITTTFSLYLYGFYKPDKMAKIKEATAKIVALNHRKRKDGTLPLYLRIIYNRQKKLYALRMATTENNFYKETGRYKKNKEGNIQLNAYIAKAEKIIQKLQDNGSFSFYQFEEQFFNKIAAHTVFSCLQVIAEELEAEGRMGTARPYKNLSAALRKFIKSKALRFEDLTPAFLRQFERSLKLKGLKQTSISIYLRTLRATFNRAIREKLVKPEVYPFRDFKIRAGSAQKIALTKDEILNMLHYSAAAGSALKDSINFFVLSYFLRGMNFTDMCKLRWDWNFLDDRLVYTRQKTERSNQQAKTINIAVKDHIAAILRQYAHNDPYILPVLEPGLSIKTARHRIHGRLKKINQDIRLVAERLGIPDVDKITFYTARHTYATVLKFSGVSVEQISESLGHSSINTTKAYLRSFGSEVLDKNDELLL